MRTTYQVRENHELLYGVRGGSGLVSEHASRKEALDALRSKQFTNSAAPTQAYFIERIRR